MDNKNQTFILFKIKDTVSIQFPTIETKVSRCGNFIFPLWKLLFPLWETLVAHAGNKSQYT